MFCLISLELLNRLWGEIKLFVYKLENIDVNEKQAQLVKIYVKNNDYVEKGDLLCSLETTKVIFDVLASSLDLS